MKGIIASDIDGTLTDENHVIPQPVADYLEKLHGEGWSICLVTGRMFSFAKKAIGSMRFPYLLALQNGAEVRSMPDETPVVQNFMSGADLLKIAQVSPDFIAYAGSEKADCCYHQPGSLSLEKKAYLNQWKEIASWEEVKGENFSLVKYFGTREKLKRIEASLAKEGCFSLSTIQDIVDRSLYMLLITAKSANKGQIVRYLIEKNKWKGPLIAAGDQSNDLPLFLEADCCIAMLDADRDLLEHADIVAPVSIEMGIIEGLTKALSWL